MQALKHSCLVKLESTGVKTLQVKSRPQQTIESTAGGKRFLAILLSCLAAWGT
jgi:hypothetical protein